MRCDRLVQIGVYTKYLCVHPMSSISTKSMANVLDSDFAHFIYQRANGSYGDRQCYYILVTRISSVVQGESNSNPPPSYWTSLTCHQWCSRRTNLDRQAGCHRSSLPPKAALLEFFMHYCQAPLSSRYLSSYLLNG